jgi:hypothetical protein
MLRSGLPSCPLAAEVRYTSECSAIALVCCLPLPNCSALILLTFIFLSLRSLAWSVHHTNQQRCRWWPCAQPCAHALSVVMRSLLNHPRANNRQWYAFATNRRLSCSDVSGYPGPTPGPCRNDDAYMVKNGFATCAVMARVCPIFLFLVSLFKNLTDH